MSEFDEVGEVVNLGPFDRFISVVVVCKQLDGGCVSFNELVTTHTGIHGGNACDWGVTSPRMAVLAIHLVLTNMQAVVKMDWLVRFIARIVHRVTRAPHTGPGLLTLRKRIIT